MLVQIHILQNYAPSNLNRDDSGSPKDAFFGGVKRGRISSQSTKRSIRHSDAFKAAFEEKGLLASRTKLLPGLIDAELKGLGVDEETRAAIVARIPEIGRESDKGDASKSEDDEIETKQLIFIGPDERKPLAEKLLAIYQEKGSKEWSNLKIGDLTKELGASIPRSVDVAMFGRMTTSAAFEDVQAAVQVAHSLTTSAVETEFDYFTAVDDISGKSGAGMIGDVEFNSATHYKYFNIHWGDLVKNLGADDDKSVAKEAVAAFLQAAATAQPSGKQNSFAAHNLPDLIMVEVSKRNLPVSYANAFVKPVRQNYEQSLMDASIVALNNYASRLRKVYSLDGKCAFISVSGEEISSAEKKDSLDDLGTWLLSQLPE